MAIVVIVVVMAMMRLSKRRSRAHQNEREQQKLLHGPIVATGVLEIGWNSWAEHAELTVLQAFTSDPH